METVAVQVTLELSCSLEGIQDRTAVVRYSLPPVTRLRTSSRTVAIFQRVPGSLVAAEYLAPGALQPQLWLGPALRLAGQLGRLALHHGQAAARPALGYMITLWHTGISVI